MFDRQALHDIMRSARYVAKPDDWAGSAGVSRALGDASDVGSDYTLESPSYSDQIPPFDITLVGVNEFGSATTMRIHGVHLISEGTGVSVDDNVQEAQMTFVAQQVTWWKPVESDADKLDIDDISGTIVGLQ